MNYLVLFGLFHVMELVDVDIMIVVVAVCR